MSHPARPTDVPRPLWLLLLAILAVPLAAPLAAQPLILRAAHMIDVAAGTRLANPVLVIENGRITAVNPGQLPANAETLDLGDVTLLPGLMDLHTHLTGSLDGDWVNRPVKESTADAAFRAAKNAETTLMAGFTTVRDLGSGGFVDVALKHAVERGDVAGPWVVPVGHALGITGGHCDATGYAPGILENDYRQGIADGPDGVTRAVRYQIKHGAQFIKICATAGVLSHEGPVGAQQFSDAEMAAIVAEAARHGVRVAAHAHGSEGILAAVQAGVASIEHGSLLTDEIIAEMKARGTFLVPTMHLSRAINLDALPPNIRSKAEFVLPRMRESLAKAIAAGVNVAFGTDAAVIPHGINAREFADYVALGMTPAEALRTATVHAATLLDLNDRGRIAPGLLADLIAVPGNPLDDVAVLEEVVFVMRGGTVFKHTQP